MPEVPSPAGKSDGSITNDFSSKRARAEANRRRRGRERPPGKKRRKDTRKNYKQHGAWAGTRQRTGDRFAERLALRTPVRWPIQWWSRVFSHRGASFLRKRIPMSALWRRSHRREWNTATGDPRWPRIHRCQPKCSGAATHFGSTAHLGAGFHSCIHRPSAETTLSRLPSGFAKCGQTPRRPSGLGELDAARRCIPPHA